MGGIPSAINRKKVVDLELRKLDILKKEEETWRQKSWGIGFIKADLNTKFFHSYIDNRQVINFIWEISRDDGHRRLQAKGGKKTFLEYF